MNTSTKTKSDGNPYRIRNGEVSVSIFSVDHAHLVASALNYVRTKRKRVRIWSNDYRNFKVRRFAHLEDIVLPDGRSNSPYIMQCCGGIWCALEYPNFEDMKPKGKEAGKKAYTDAGPSFCHIYEGWQTQP